MTISTMAVMFRFYVVFFILLSVTGVRGNEYDCEVVKYASYCRITGNKLFETDSIIIQINNRTGEKYCEVELNSDKSNPVTGLSAWIEDSNGTVIRYLKNKEITESNYFSSSFYTDEYTLKFVLKHNQYPYRICYTYQRSYKDYLDITHWYPYIGLDVPTHNASLTVTHPENFGVTIVQSLTGPPFTSSHDGIITSTWRTKYDGSLREETFAPRIIDFIPKVIIIPKNFMYSFEGSMESWNSLGKWVYNLNKGLDVLPENEIQAIKNKISGISDKKEIIRVLYHFLQDNTHYINIDIGIGGYKPYPASYVAQNKFGDCKALTIYMKALLKTAGIESFYVLVNAGNRKKQFYPETPFQQFNHVILAVPVDKDTIWLENTASGHPFGYLGSFTQDRHGLLVDENTSRLVRIPPLSLQDVQTSGKRDFFLKEEGSANVMARMILRGPPYEKYIDIMDNYGHDDQNRIVHKLMPYSTFEILDWRIVKPRRDSRNLIFLVSVDVPHFLSTIGQEYYFSFQPLELADFESPRIRKMPVQIPYPVSIADTLTYHLPDGKHFTHLPEGKELTSKFGTYKTSFIKEDHTLQICRTFELYPITVPVSDYPEFFQFIQYIKTDEKQKILFQ